MADEIYTEVRKHFPPNIVFAPGGEEALRGIYNLTLGQFMQLPTSAGLWQHEPLRQFVFKVVAEIGNEAQVLAGPSQPVAEAQLYQAARSVMVRRKDDCRAVIKPQNQQKAALDIEKIIGGMCPTTFTQG